MFSEKEVRELFSTQYPEELATKIQNARHLPVSVRITLLRDIEAALGRPGSQKSAARSSQTRAVGAAAVSPFRAAMSSLIAEATDALSDRPDAEPAGPSDQPPKRREEPSVGEPRQEEVRRFDSEGGAQTPTDTG